HLRSRPEERLLAPRAGTLPVGLPDPGRLGTRGIDGAARTTDRRAGSVVHGAADADLLVNARVVRVAPGAELRQGKRMAPPGRPAPRRPRPRAPPLTSGSPR